VVGAALAGVALATLAGVAGLATRSLRLARDTSTALALASERLEALRVGPAADGSDVTVMASGTAFARSWRVAGGRGRPVDLSVRVAWGDHALSLGTEVLP
jgi:hypothetical protein